MIMDFYKLLGTLELYYHYIGRRLMSTFIFESDLLYEAS